MSIKEIIKEFFAEASSGSAKLLLMASTMEPVVTGLLDVLENEYYRQSGIIVRHVGAGSGQAMALGIMGRVDLVLTHAPEMEDDFITAGYGLQRFPVMQNNFYLVGTTKNKAGLQAGNMPIKEALEKIFHSKAPFISRSDGSGTHFRELRLWEWLGLEPVGQPWYHNEPKIGGSKDVMQLAVQLDGYTLVDRASYLAGGWFKDLEIYVQKDAFLTNIFSVIPVNSSIVLTKLIEAERYAEWLSGEDAALIIDNFGRHQYGYSLFSSLFTHLD